MSDLAELQRRFQQCVLAPPGDMAQPWVRAGGRAAPARQLSAYIFAYAARLKEVLANDFPALQTAIGDEAFDHLAQAYIETHPSQYFSLRDFGDRMAEFINAHPVHHAQPWRGELAAFEWALAHAFDAADTPVATIEDMATIAPEYWLGLRFLTHPSVQRLDFTSDAPGIWTEMMADQPTPLTPTTAGAVPWLVWREQLTTRFRSLQPDECLAFDCLCAGGDFGKICEQLATLVDDTAVPLRAASLLKGWISQGLISVIQSHEPLSG